ncbi:17977_t:CDS:2, partial [Cetraspora pellucida]
NLPIDILENNLLLGKLENNLPIDTSTVESGCPFTTFAKACATIEKYAMQTNSVIILGKTTKNFDNSYRQALFVYEKQEKYSSKNKEFITKCTGCLFAIGLNYHKHANEYVIMKSCLKHNHDICLNATKFSTVIRKLDNNDLGLVEKLYDNGLRTKDIFSVLNSVSSKYIHKPDVYNAVSHQHKLLLKTLHDNESIIENIVLKTAYNSERDQDGEFIQAVFWAYCALLSDCYLQH